MSPYTYTCPSYSSSLSVNSIIFVIQARNKQMKTRSYLDFFLSLTSDIQSFNQYFSLNYQHINRDLNNFTFLTSFVAITLSLSCTAIVLAGLQASLPAPAAVILNTATRKSPWTCGARAYSSSNSEPSGELTWSKSQTPYYALPYKSLRKPSLLFCTPISSSAGSFTSLAYLLGISRMFLQFTRYYVLPQGLSLGISQGMLSFDMQAAYSVISFGSSLNSFLGKTSLLSGLKFQSPLMFHISFCLSHFFSHHLKQSNIVYILRILLLIHPFQQNESSMKAEIASFVHCCLQSA